MDIGTAKPSLTERQRIPHHCINIVDPNDDFNAGRFGNLARKIVESIFERDRVPVVVGGSGLYIRALVDGLFSSGERDERIRQRLRSKAARSGWDTLYDDLHRLDPSAARRIHPNDKKRIIRALEVYHLTGRPISELQKTDTIPAPFQTRFFGLQWGREALYRRIDDRVDAMVHSGLIDEVKMLRKMGYSSTLNSMDSAGYKEVFAFLDGKMNMEDTIDSIKKNSRRFAKRQIAWFKRDNRIRWIRMTDPPKMKDAARYILEERMVYNKKEP